MENNNEIKFSVIVRGSLTTKEGYVEIASTQTHAILPNDFENRHSEDFSSEYASLLAFRTENSPFLSVIHIQGQHIGSSLAGRIYDTRIFYNIDSASLRNCHLKIGSIVGSLPRILSFSEKKFDLTNSVYVKPYRLSKSEAAINGLSRYIMQAIVEGKRLIVKLDRKDAGYWKENGVLENNEAQMLFVAIDSLPEILRPVASFALSVDEKFDKDILKYTNIILYHGNRNNLAIKIDSNTCIEVAWDDLDKNNNDKFFNQQDFFSKVALCTINKYQSENFDFKYKDFFNSKLSSKGMLDGIYDVQKDPNLKKSVEYLKIQKDWERLIRHPEVIDKIRVNAEELDFNLNNLYNFFENNKKVEIREKYVEFFCLTKSELQVNKQLEILKTILNIPDANIEKELKNLLLNKLTLQIFHQNLNIDEWIEVAELFINTKYEQQLIEKTKQQDLYFFEKLYKKGKYLEIVGQCFKETTAYKNNFKEICQKPFIDYLPEEKLQMLRFKFLSNCESSDFKEIYKDLKFEEVEKFLVNKNNDEYIVKLIIKYFPNKCKQFIEQNSEITISQIGKAILNNDDVTNSEIYKLYKKADLKPTKPQIELTISNLENIYNNTQKLEFDISNEITKLYISHPIITNWKKIHETTNQNPPEEFTLNEIIDKNELKAYQYLLKQNIKLPEINIEKMIKNTNDYDSFCNLFDDLTELKIDFSEFKKTLEKKQFERKNIILKKYFNNKSSSSLSQENIRKRLVILILIALIIGFGGGYNMRSLITSKKEQKETTLNSIQDTVNIQTHDLVNQTFLIFYRKQINNDIYSNNDTIKANEKSLADWFSLYKEKNLIVDSIKLKDSVYLLKLKIDGPESATIFYQKIDSIINNLK